MTVPISPSDMPPIAPVYATSGGISVEQSSRALKGTLEHFNRHLMQVLDDPSLKEDPAFLQQIQEDVLQLSQQITQAKQVLG